MRNPLAVAITLTSVALTGCGSDDERGGPQAAISVSSPSFANDADLPADFTCDGAGVSPALSWSGVPDEAAELALVVSDPDAPGGTFVHWIVTGVDATISSVEEGTTPSGGTEVANNGGASAYEPACPPDGVHRYRFTVYALSQAPSVTDAMTPPEVVASFEDAALAQGTLTANYERTP